MNEIAINKKITIALIFFRFFKSHLVMNCMRGLIIIFFSVYVELMLGMYQVFRQIQIISIKMKEKGQEQWLENDDRNRSRQQAKHRLRLSIALFAAEVAFGSLPPRSAEEGARSKRFFYVDNDGRFSARACPIDL